MIGLKNINKFSHNSFIYFSHFLRLSLGLYLGRWGASFFGSALSASRFYLRGPKLCIIRIVNSRTGELDPSAQPWFVISRRSPEVQHGTYPFIITTSSL